MTKQLPKGLDLTQDNLIECIIRRKGGTKVDFGFSNNKKVEYFFQPIDSTDPDSPHVCNVADESHYQRFVNIPESYRGYYPDEEYQAVSALPSPAPIDDYEEDENIFDILAINAEEVSNDWLIKYGKEVLKVKSKQSIADLATTQYKLEFNYDTATAVDILRMILVERQNQERNADNLG